MATSPTDTPLLTSRDHDAIVGAVAADAARDAHRVADLLDSLGVQGTQQRPIRLSGEFLLELGAAMRIHEWEIAGFNLHLDVGLPKSEVIINNAFRHLVERGIIPNGGELPRQVLALFLSRFAWHAHRHWGAPVALDLIDEDAALDALAELVWSRRHAGRVTVN
jgi:hypothetical protein